jgi:PAS domain S-box-containing protein
MASTDLQMQQYFHLFMDSREEPHFLASLAGELLAANPAACGMLGREEEELRACNITSLVTVPETARKCLRNWPRLTAPLPEPLTWLGRNLQRFQSFGYGSLIEHKPSTRQYLLIHATPAVAASEQFIDSSKTLRELHSSEKKLLATSRQLQQKMVENWKIKTALTESLARLTTILDSIDTVAYITEPQTYEIQFINRYGRQLLGELTGRICWQSLRSDQEGPCSFCANQDLLPPDGLPGVVGTRDYGNATTSWHHTTLQAIPWTDGRVVRLGIANDLTDRKKADFSLDEWELTFDAIDEVVTIHDQEMRIIRANKATARLLGVDDPAELIGRHCYEVVRNASEPCAGCPELLARTDLQPHEEIICHDNLKKTFLVSSSPLIDKQGFHHGFIHMAKDVTRQRVLEDKLQHTQKMEAIGVLAGGIAHDFNNILAPIVGYTELALKRSPSASGVVPYLQQINRAASRARELVQQILTFGRQAPQEKKPLQLHLVVNEVLKLLRSPRHHRNPAEPAGLRVRAGRSHPDPPDRHESCHQRCARHEG